MTNGKTGETMLNLALEQAGCGDISSRYKSTELLAIADRVRPGRVDNVKLQRSGSGKSTRWEVTPAKSIIDWVYGLDLIINPVPGKVFGYGVTCNPEAIASKISKLKDFTPLWKEIGIDKVGVIYITSKNDDWGWACLTPSQKDEIVDKVLDSIVYATDESPEESVRVYTIAV